jgi:predicted transcriptional regulator
MKHERRSKLEIYCVILNSILYEHKNSDIVRPTRIQFQSGLSYDSLQKYLNELQRKKFIHPSKITVTKKGERFLKDFEKIREAIKQIGLKY